MQSLDDYSTWDMTTTEQQSLYDVSWMYLRTLIIIEAIDRRLEQRKPNVSLFVVSADDSADPHGTHRVCLNAIFEAFQQLKGEAWMEDCWLWLYRGAWHEWPMHDTHSVRHENTEHIA